MLGFLSQYRDPPSRAAAADISATHVRALCGSRGGLGGIRAGMLWWSPVWITCAEGGRAEKTRGRSEEGKQSTAFAALPPRAARGSSPPHHSPTSPAKRGVFRNHTCSISCAVLYTLLFPGVSHFQLGRGCHSCFFPFIRYSLFFTTTFL